MHESSRQPRGMSPVNVVTTPPPFIGRRSERELLEGSLDDAIGGRPQLVLIPGDAGIGKTRLLKELRSVATHRGVRCYYARCYEELTLPYLPLVEPVLAQLVSEGTQHAAGAEVAVIRQLLHPDVAASGTDAALSGASSQDKLRLFLAVSRVTIALARVMPTLLIVDDLHWADQSSLDLFAHLVFAAADAAGQEPLPLMLVATYRRVEPDDPLARIIARLQREEICRTLELPGLSESEVDELIEGLGLLHPAHQLVATVSQATRGNPLFVQEVVHHLVRQGALQEQGGHLVATVAPAELRLPEQVTAAIAARVQGLSEGCRQIATLAALLGEHIALATLSAVSGIGEDELLDPLEEAIGQRLLVSEGATFQFAHPLIRHVLYSEPSVPRRQRLHRQIADTLERLYAERPDEHVLEIAHHLVAAGPAAEPDTLIEYARRAGDQALTVFAWHEAASYYEAALTAAASGGLSLNDRAELHYRAGFAHYRDWDAGPCLDQYAKAIDAYRLSGDIVGLARTLKEKTHAHFTLASVPYGTLIDIQPLEEALRALGDREPALCGRIWTTIAHVYWTARQPEQATEMALRALRAGQAINDDRLCAEAGVGLALAQMQSMHAREALHSYEAALAAARRVDDLWLHASPLLRIPGALTRLGRLADADAVAQEACELTSKIHDWGEHSLALAARAYVAVARGAFDAAEQYAHEVMTMVRRSRYPWGGAEALPALACARALRGEWAEAEDAIDTLIQPGRVFDEPGPPAQILAWLYRQLVHAHAGDIEDVRQHLAASPRRLQPDVRTDIYALPAFAALVEIADRLSDPTVAEPAYPALARAVGRDVMFSIGWVFLIPRVLGVAATLHRGWDRAEGHFRTAIDTAAAAGARAELGRSYLDYARMLAARAGPNDRRAAADLVRHAAPIFDELGMTPFARDAAALAEALHCELTPASTPAAAPALSRQKAHILQRLARGRTDQEIADELVLSPTTVAHHVSTLCRTPLVVFFSDMVGSTEIITTLGDAEARRVMESHDTITRQCLSNHHGTEIQHTGDGFMVSFPTASDAVTCAIAIQHAFAAHNRTHLHRPICVRIGLHAGEPLAESGRLFGAAVNAAARICSRADSGEILASDVVRQLVAGQRITFADRGRVALKGFPERFRLYAVQWNG